MANDRLTLRERAHRAQERLRSWEVSLDENEHRAGSRIGWLSGALAGGKVFLAQLPLLAPYTNDPLQEVVGTAVIALFAGVAGWAVKEGGTWAGRSVTRATRRVAIGSEAVLASVFGDLPRGRALAEARVSATVPASPAVAVSHREDAKRVRAVAQHLLGSIGNFLDLSIHEGMRGSTSVEIPAALLAGLPAGQARPGRLTRAQVVGTAVSFAEGALRERFRSRNADDPRPTALALEPLSDSGKGPGRCQLRFDTPSRPPREDSMLAPRTARFRKMVPELTTKLHTELGPKVLRALQQGLAAGGEDPRRVNVAIDRAWFADCSAPYRALHRALPQFRAEIEAQGQALLIGTERVFRVKLEPRLDARQPWKDDSAVRLRIETTTDLTPAAERRRAVALVTMHLVETLPSFRARFEGLGVQRSYPLPIPAKLLGKAQDRDGVVREAIELATSAFAANGVEGKGYFEAFPGETAEGYVMRLVVFRREATESEPAPATASPVERTRTPTVSPEPTPWQSPSPGVLPGGIPPPPAPGAPAVQYHASAPLKL